MLSPDLQANADEHYEDRVVQGLPPEYAISAAGLPDQPINVILDRARDALVHAVIRRTTVGALQEHGYTVRLTDEPTAHVDVVLPSPPSEAHWEALRSIFGPPFDNPVRRPKGGWA
jgi:hypothetical protein